MPEIIRRHPFGFFLAVLMHLGIVALMIFGLDWLNPPEAQKPAGKIVQARLIDTRQLENEKQDKLRKLKEQQVKTAQQQRRKEAEVKRRKDLKIKQQEKKKKQEQQRRKAEAEKKHQLALKKKEQEKKRKLEEKKRREAEARKKAEAKKKEDARKKVEQERRKKAAARKKAEQERRRKAEAERKRKAAELAAQKAREAELEAQWAAEKDQRERASVTAAIKRKVQRSWLRPPTASNQNLQATVRVRLNSRGSVLLVRVVKSSGNAAFDRSVVTAVNKADPLPMPKSKTLISEFREFTFIFRPTS
jgi:colicin import membrane protein